MAGKMKTMDGNKAAAYVSYAFTECSAIFPITPSSPMAEYIDEWSSQGQKNLFGQPVRVVEMQSEAGAAGALHGALTAGALSTTYTASQGLLLMIPNMYKMAGELLPGVIHVSARAVGTHALSIFGDHSDVMACRQTGFAMLASGNVQEVMDLAGVAHLAAVKSRVPFLHFFDGFRTSHEMQKIEVIDYQDFAALVDHGAIEAFRTSALSPEHPVTKGTAQNPDIFFQAREACNPYYVNVPDIVARYMRDIGAITGRDYRPFDYYGPPDAEYVIVAMGSVCDVIEETVNYLGGGGEKVGLVKVRLYRPFSGEYLFGVLPRTVKKIAVLDRTKEPGALGEPLYEDLRTVFYDRPEKPVIIGGRYGLGSKDVVPADIMAVYDNLQADTPKNGFTLGITDDVTHLSLQRGSGIDVTPEGTIQCKFFGLGSDGTVGANKQAVEIIGDNTGLYTQAYFAYDSKKSGGNTISHLRFGKNPIRCPYLITDADFVSCSNQSYVYSLNLLSGLKAGGTFLLNCTWSPETLAEKLPASVKRYMADHRIQFYIINAVQIADELGLGNRTNMIMQAAFFKLAGVIPLDQAVRHLKDSIREAYGRKGEDVVGMNCAAVDRGIGGLVRIDVPAAWARAADQPAGEEDVPAFVRNILGPISRLEGDSLPVSAFKDVPDGRFPPGTARYEKRGVADFVPRWIKENCIQCNQCSLVCPHAAIRPVLLSGWEAAPASLATIPAVGKQLAGLSFAVQVSPLDCLGCGCCVNTCPAKKKALELKPREGEVAAQRANWDFAVTVPGKAGILDPFTVKGSQFAQPLLEFSGACQGCTETPYAKLVTQLFGDRMFIANATGCSSIWGGSAPSTPYCTNGQGQGPAWANSLFEDNAEYGYGMAVAVRQVREGLAGLVKEALALDISPALREGFQEWADGMDDAAVSRAAAAKIRPLLEKGQGGILDEITARRDFFVKPSFWVFGGDGWAYDIGYGGLDHVLASGEDINVLVFDTEVYSNTGGQSSKSTPAAAIARFAASGKKTGKKDLGLMAMSYGYVYVAQIAMGASQTQTIKAIKEAEAYRGPSLIIAYAPCINHGLKAGMGHSQDEMDKAVKAGYWHLYRFNPDRSKEGENPFILDSKEPTGSFREFIEGEVRYASLKQLFPAEAGKLFDKTEQDARDRYERYLRLAGGK
ncbi:MAG: pyruvate:ferredoxin (flavodoxin) oxidoreductase [Peptococcaceae bacterium]|jgi:pyruvate-ferredoxin/flavodoxin oxidoreductase|nr:pyruvate:ferredoxin (flavodoxin) oxidoreductase [Peptococcaceae bacterium]